MELAPLRLAEHKAFLRLVHSAPDGGDELYIGRALPGAIERYLKCWLPLVALEGSRALVPPLDVAWVWHLHRLAPCRYAAYCTERFGRVLDPAAAAFQAQSAEAAETDIETQQLWQQHFGDEPFFQRRGEGGSSPTERGPRDPHSNQTTVCAEIKEACVRVRSAHGFDYDVECCSARQRTFLWQVSQPAFSEGGAKLADTATTRYLLFLGLMKKHGYDQHFYVPSYDIDFAWHAHMLNSTREYLLETALLAAAPGGMDHDDSINQRHDEHGRLHLSWAETKELWALEHGGNTAIDLPGVTYCGEPPDWWFKADGAEIFRVSDNFLSECEVADALDQLSCKANIRGRSHSGLDMVCAVSGDVMRRLRQQLEAEPAVAGQEETAGEETPEEEPTRQEEPAGQETAGHELAGQELAEEETAGQETTGDVPSAVPVQAAAQEQVPARVCPSSKSVPLHKDKDDGKGVCMNNWICVVYLSHQPHSALVLVDDLTGREHRIAIEPGRLCCWPNARFSHRVDVEVGAVKGQDAEPERANLRCMPRTPFLQR
jgi:hypothetical protein